MIGILVALLVSWILLYLTERKNILSLGFLPVLLRLKQFVLGFLITAVLCARVQTLELILQSSSWYLNENYNANLILNMFWWDFKSVLTEELIFRGALLIILIRRLGVEVGIIISAVAFGIYHWFSFGILGNILPMIIVFIGTGLMGYAWALAFAKTKSILMPLGLHLGWNFTFNTIFSKGPLGNGLLISEGGNTISNWFSLAVLWGIPAMMFLIIKFWIPTETNDLTDKEVKTTANTMQ